MRSNPYRYDGYWYWQNGDGNTEGPYLTEGEALLDALKRAAALPWYKGVWNMLAGLWHDTRG